MKALLGRKIGMSQIFTPEGVVIPVTLVVAEANKVTLRRTMAKDGYEAVQVAMPHVTRDKMVAWREFPLEIADDITEVTLEQFSIGDRVEVVGVSKGKGFQGVVKRHNFKGGPKSHGHRHVLRRPGSIGSRFPQHVTKGKRMAGRMGGDRVTVKNLVIVSIDADKKIVAVKGAVPGKRGSLLVIKSA